MSRFHFRHFSLYHDRSTMKVGTDAVMLGAWVQVNPTDVALDIGTGCGVLSLMLAQKGVAKIDAVDIDEPSVYEAATNFEASRWRDRISAYHADIRRFGFGRKYDLIISNPPFYLNSYKCEADRKNQARHTDTSLSFNDLVISVKHLLKPEGRFALVLPERESHDFIPVANKSNLYIYRKQNIIPVENKESNRINLELRYNEPESVEESTLVMRDAEGRFTEAYHAFLKDFYLG